MLEKKLTRESGNAVHNFMVVIRSLDVASFPTSQLFPSLEKPYPGPGNFRSVV